MKKKRTQKKKTRSRKKTQRGGFVCAGACGAAAVTTGLSSASAVAVPVGFSALILGRSKKKSTPKKKSKTSKSKKVSRKKTKKK